MPRFENAHEETLRAQIAKTIHGGEAHLDAAAVFSDVQAEHWGTRAKGAPHTLWQLLEHTRFTLHDLYIFSTDPEYKAPKWPDDYWPGSDAPADADAVSFAVSELLRAQTALVELIEKPGTDLFAKIPWGDGQTILREALLAATHTSYHLGQAMFLRKQLEA